MRDHVEVLLQNHQRFLRFLKRRVRDESAAEDLLQSAFVKSLERAGSIRDGEKSVAWFYRLLRNALADRGRRLTTERRVLSGLRGVTRDEELHREICRCVRRLADTLRPDYAFLVRRVDLENRPVSRIAAELGISPNNAMVRLHRARKSLHKALVKSCGTCTRHGCLDCHCGSDSGTKTEKP